MKKIVLAIAVMCFTIGMACAQEPKKTNNNQQTTTQHSCSHSCGNCAHHQAQNTATTGHSESCKGHEQKTANAGQASCCQHHEADNKSQAVNNKSKKNKSKKASKKASK